jgi:hypothetical protein
MRLLALGMAVLLIAIAGLARPEAVSSADDEEQAVECVVAGATVIDCDDEGIWDAHGENCEVVHYHGELNGAPDPDENGCGHGEVTERPVASEEEDSGILDTIYTWFDVAFQGISGGFSPKSVQESVEIVEEASEGIAANAENAEEYFETYPDAPDRDRYTLENESGEHGWLYNAFWGLFE